MVARGDVWEGHELVSNPEDGMVHTFLARQVGDTRSLVWLHMREGSRVEHDVFADEIKRLQRIAEEVPQIDRVLYGGVRDGVAWVASPFHGNAIRLKQAIQGADLGLTGLKLAIELGEYLAQGNQRGWVHGAMNPEHVIITSSGGYLLTYFGFVRLFEIGEQEAGRDPRYAAPELLFGKRPINKRTDVYGLGTILYELLCRRELHAGEQKLAYCALSREPAYPIAVPPRVRRVIAKAIAKSPLDRYPNVEHLLQELHALVDDWNKLDATPEVFEPPHDPLRSAPEEAPAPPHLPPPPLETSPIASTRPSEATESPPAAELSTLAPPSPRVYEPAPISWEPTLAPDAQQRPEPPKGARPGRRASRPALMAALASAAALVVAVALLRWERPAPAAARLAWIVQATAARQALDHSVAHPEPTPGAPPIPPALPAPRRVAVARRAVASSHIEDAQAERERHYAWEGSLQY